MNISGYNIIDVYLYNKFIDRWSIMVRFCMFLNWNWSTNIADWYFDRNLETPFFLLKRWNVGILYYVPIG